jgi:hypothetical protein
MDKKILIFVLLAAYAFFNPFLIFSPQIQKLIFYIAVVIAGLYYVSNRDDSRTSDFPYLNFMVLLGAILVSDFMASIQHEQGFLATVQTSLSYLLAYSFVLVLLRSNLEVKDVINCILIICGLSIVIYFGNLITFPNNIFIKPLFEDISRGMLRIPVPYGELFILLVFYGINQINLENDKKKWTWVVAISLLMILLSVVRQMIALTFILGFWFYLKNISALKKIIFSVIVLVVIFYVVPQIPMFQAMMELTQSQQDDAEEEDDIRLQAWEYYTVGNQSSVVSPVLGNGVPALGISRWGRYIDRERYFTEMYPEDVGWAGFFWYFGGVATIALAALLIRAILKRKNEDENYLTYWFIYIFITSIASAPILYYNQIISISVALYLVYIPKNETDRHHNSNLQQLRRYA